VRAPTPDLTAILSNSFLYGQLGNRVTRYTTDADSVKVLRFVKSKYWIFSYL